MNLKSKLVIFLSCAAMFIWSLPALANDDVIACVNIGDDAGTTGFIDLDGGVNKAQIMVRCDNYSTHQVIKPKSGTLPVATAQDSVIDSDKNIDICVDSPLKDNRLSLYRQYDGGVATCCAYTVVPRTGYCPKGAN